jgi:type II secretory pathway component GspD/PulD (secretin)
MKLKKYFPYIILIPSLAVAEQQLSFVGDIKCIASQNKTLSAEYTLLEKERVPQIRWKEFTINLYKENYSTTKTATKTSSFRIKLAPIKDVFLYVDEKFSLLQTHSGICSDNSLISIKIDKPIDALTLLLQLTKAFNFQYQIDGDLLYAPSYIVLKQKNIPVKQLVNLLIQRINKFNPWLKIELSWTNKTLTISGDVYNINQIQQKYANVLARYLTYSMEFELSKKEELKTRNINPLCDTVNYLDICKENSCERYLLNLKDNKIQLVPYKTCVDNQTQGTFKIENICKLDNVISTLYLDNINLSQLLKVFEQLFNIKFVYNESDLSKIKNSQNLHLAFSCLTKEKALEFLQKNFHLYLEKIAPNIYRIFTNKDDYSLVLRDVSNYISKVIYLKGISINDFTKYLELYYAGKVQYSADPTFNAVILIGPKKIIDEILNRFAVYIRNSNSFDNLMSKIFYVKYGDPQDLAKQMENYLSRKGVIKILEDVNAIEVTDYPANISMIEKVFKGFLSQHPVEIKVSVKFVQVQKSFLKNLGFNWNIGWSGTSGGKSLVPSVYHYPVGNAPAAYSVNPDYLATFNNGALTFSPVFVYKKLNPLALQLQASEQVGLSKTLSSPYLVLLNGKQGTLTQGIQIPYQSVDRNGNPTTTFKTAALTLDITPRLLPDGRILLNIKLSKDSPATNAPTSNAGPAINTFNIEQNFIVPNGESIIIGGVLDRNHSESTSGVPGLMRIPLLGWLFKVKNWNNQDNELIVIITAKVINQ